jgi:hypothetical protein
VQKNKNNKKHVVILYNEEKSKVLLQKLKGYQIMFQNLILKKGFKKNDNHFSILTALT